VVSHFKNDTAYGFYYMFLYLVCNSVICHLKKGRQAVKPIPFLLTICAATYFGFMAGGWASGYGIWIGVAVGMAVGFSAAWLARQAWALVAHFSRFSGDVLRRLC
jgi:hypothetical protein